MRMRDNGIGLRADMLERVFNMFEQVDRTYSQVTVGLGIGLTLVRRLVEMQGGSVRAESGGLGAGTEFVVRLPLATPSIHPEQPGDRERSRAGPVDFLRVLVADDNEDAAASLAMYLEMAGHAVRVAMDGARAVAIAEEFRPQLAILDIAMPVMDGLEAARAMRAFPEGKGIVILALSGFGQESDRQRSAAAGFDDHLVKPPDLDRIDKIINSISSDSR